MNARADEPTERPIRDLPSAAEREDEIMRRIGTRRPAVFLDYDGTLTPIVDDPDAARLPAGTREVLARLARLCPVAIVSGRDLADVRARVGLDELCFAGSHGFDIAGPGLREERGREYLPALDAAERALEDALAAIPGAAVERKRFAVAAHFRRADPAGAAGVEDLVKRVAADHPDLRVTAGKKVLELRPALAWDKGAALGWLLETLELDGPEVVPLYLGDDVTDEDAFATLADRGIGLVVRGEDDERVTRADYALADPDAARTSLARLAERLDGRPADR